MTPTESAKIERNRVLEELTTERDMAFGTLEYYGLAKAVEVVEGMQDADYSKSP